VDPDLRNSLLRRFWLVLPAGTPGQYGCGVTAFSLEDALRVLQRDMMGGRPVPSPLRVVEDGDVSTLDHGHVIPNMDECVTRGIWFPRGFRPL
jgi:hypothetical protein